MSSLVMSMDEVPSVEVQAFPTGYMEWPIDDDRWPQRTLSRTHSLQRTTSFGLSICLTPQLQSSAPHSSQNAIFSNFSAPNASGNVGEDLQLPPRKLRSGASDVGFEGENVSTSASNIMFCGVPVPCSAQIAAPQMVVNDVPSTPKHRTRAATKKATTSAKKSAKKQTTDSAQKKASKKKSRVMTKEEEEKDAVEHLQLLTREPFSFSGLDEMVVKVEEVYAQEMFGGAGGEEMFGGPDEEIFGGADEDDKADLDYVSPVKKKGKVRQKSPVGSRFIINNNKNNNNNNSNDKNDKNEKNDNDVIGNESKRVRAQKVERVGSPVKEELVFPEGEEGQTWKDLHALFVSYKGRMPKPMVRLLNLKCEYPEGVRLIQNSGTFQVWINKRILSSKMAESGKETPAEAQIRLKNLERALKDVKPLTLELFQRSRSEGSGGWTIYFLVDHEEKMGKVKKPRYDED